ncbi:MAG TPA: hypothetical protein VGH99_08135 [Pseudonocardia sp.]
MTVPAPGPADVRPAGLGAPGPPGDRRGGRGTARAGSRSGDDPALSGEAAWHGSRQLIGLSLGATAHPVPERIGAAASALVDLLARGVLREPAPSVRPLAEAAAVHRALEQRSAPAKTVLAVRR